MKTKKQTMNRTTILSFIAVGLLAFMVSCGEGEAPVHGEQPAATQAEEPAAAEAPAAEAPAGGLDGRIAAGKVAYEKVCQACHQADGKGLPNAFPPLAQSDYLDADHTRAIAGVVNGLEGEITVNGAKFNSVMPKAALSDQEIADVFTYVLNSFGNKGGEVSAAEVAATRK